jgi:hypothetical protein
MTNSQLIANAGLAHLIERVQDSIVPVSLIDGEREACCSYDEPQIIKFDVTGKDGVVISSHSDIKTAITAFEAK